MKLRFYVLEGSYKIIDDEPVIHLYGRTEDGERVCVMDENFGPYFWVLDAKPEELESIKTRQRDREIKIIRAESHRKNYLENEHAALKVFTQFPGEVALLRDELKDKFKVLEADIPFIRRYFMDKKITPLTLCEAEGEFISERGKTAFFKAQKVEQISDDTVKPKILAFDIETNYQKGNMSVPEEDPIIMIGFASENFEKVVAWKRFRTNLSYVEFVESEADLINRFKQIIEEQKPDIIAGYYSDEFDFPYLKVRADKYKINLDLGLDNSNINYGRGRRSSAQITGITHLDIFRFISRIISRSLSTGRYDLNSIALEMLGETKEEVDFEKLPEIWESSSKELEEFCRYNLQDAMLTLKLTQRILPSVTELVKIVGQPMFDISRMSFSQLVEWYLMRRAQEFNALIPNKPGHGETSERQTQTYIGGFVYEPEPGLYKNIAVFDFRSLYPSIISTHNISPDTLNCGCCPEAQKAPSEQSWFCQRKKGFIATVIDDIIKRRRRIKDMMTKSADKMLNARQEALKTVANAMYGYMGFFAARWYCLPCVKSITAYGRYYIQKVINEAKQQKFKVLYADTDSVFIALEQRTKQDAANFIEEINQNLSGLMELEYEGFYPAGIFVSLREKTYGAKKKYALIDEKGIMKVRGFETVRRNTSLISKETQEKILEIILKEGDKEKALKYLTEVIEKLRKKEIPLSKVIISTQLQKEIENYDAIGPHVAIAKKMKAMGRTVAPGSIIKFVVVQGKDKIRDRARLPEEIKEAEYDAEYYINNQVIPAVDKIFVVMGINIKEILQEKDQSKLQKFLK